MHIRDVIVIGGGPAGLSAAIAAKRAGLDYQVLEKGVLVNSIFNFPQNMVFFTTPELLELGGLPFVTPYEKPTRAEALRYYRRVVGTYNLDIAFGERVLAIDREPAAGAIGHLFAVETRSDHGVRSVSHARTVVLATGCFDRPNMLGVTGEDLPHVSHYYENSHPFFRKSVVVVGGRNSAAVASLDLYRGGATVTLVHRRSELSDSIKYWLKPDIENRIKQRSIAARFEARVLEIRPTTVVIERAGRTEELVADAVFLLTGYSADAMLLSRAGIRIDSSTCVPEHDEMTFEANVPGLFLAGTVVAGKENGKIFIENGRFHGEVVVQEVQRRLEEARS